MSTDPVEPSVFRVRPERPVDTDVLRGLHREAFGGSHGDDVVRLVDGLRRNIRRRVGASLVAERAGRLVGHVLFSPGLLDAPQRLVEVQILSPLAVAPAHQGLGIGTALVQRGLQVMAEQGVPVVFLEGPPGYYGRFGFAAGAPQGFRKPSLRIPDEAFQAIRLPAYEPWMSGTLVYPAVFWATDAVGLRTEPVEQAGD